MLGPLASWDLQGARDGKGTEVAEGTWDCKVRGVLLAPEEGPAPRVLQGALSTFSKMTLGQHFRPGWTVMEY